MKKQTNFEIISRNVLKQVKGGGHIMAAPICRGACTSACFGTETMPCTCIRGRCIAL